MPKIGEIHVFGEASNTAIKVIPVTSKDRDRSLMDFLLLHRIPVASSCSGEGICLKCKATIDEEIVISCQLKLKDLLQKGSVVVVGFSYL